jgi:hypothetical protein
MSQYVGITGLNRSAGVRVPTLVELIDQPVGAAASATGTDGHFASGTYYYKVSAVGTSGETLPSAEVNATVTGTNEQQTVTETGVTTGNFTISYGGQTATIAADSAAATVQSALQALSSIGSGNATVARSGSAGAYVYTITFTGTLAHTNVAQVTTSNGTLADGGTVAAATTVAGGSQHIAVTWTAVTSAVSYKIYRGSSTGAQDHYFTSTTNSFNDVGDTGTAGTVATTHNAVVSGGQDELASDGTVQVVDVDDIEVRKALGHHRAIGQWAVVAVNTTYQDPTGVLTLPSNS